MSESKRPRLTNDQSDSGGQLAQTFSHQPKRYDPTKAWRLAIEISVEESKEWLKTHEVALPTDEEAAARAASGSSSAEVDCPLYKAHSAIQETFGLLIDSTQAASLFLATKYKENPRALTDAELFPVEEQDFFVNAKSKPWRHGVQTDGGGDHSDVETETEASSVADGDVDMSEGADSDVGLDLPGPSVAESKRPVDSLPAALKTARGLFEDAFSQLEVLKTHLRESWQEASVAFPEPEGWSQSFLGVVDEVKQEKLTHLHHSWLNKASEVLTTVNEKCYFERVADAIATQNQYEDQRTLDYAIDRVAHDGYARLCSGMLDRWREAGEKSLAGIDSVIGHSKQCHDELQEEEVSKRYYLLVGQHELPKYKPEEDTDGLRIEWRMFFDEGQASYVEADIAKNDVSSIASGLKSYLKQYYCPHDA